MEMEKSRPVFVAQEFVRQYYRLRNKAPGVLHRSNSSYVYGGLDTDGNLAEPVYGQAGIHEKITSLQIRECHTKIRGVDAHATLNNRIVVQVLGELSNSGQPMRKFMQTFVLAPEGSVAKKYDIHSNIFCYVEEAFGKSDAKLDEVVLEPKEDVEPEPQTPKPRVGSKSKAPLPPRNQRTHDRRSFPPRSPRPGGRDGEPGVKDNRRIVPYPDSHQLFVGNLPHDTDENELKELFMTYGNVVELRINTRGVSGKLANFGFVVFDSSDPVQNILQAEPILFRGEMRLHMAEKKTWAVREREQKMRLNNRGPRGSHGIVGSGMMRGRDGEPGVKDNRRIVPYPDSHQLFIGNLPHDTDENELKELFMTYGNVVELRINTRGVIGKLPNFGFVVFDSSDPVQNILQAEPIWFRDEVHLHVEEKKAWPVRERERRKIVAK